MELHLDIETYSESDLAKTGVYRYVEDPSFEILMCAWSLDGTPVKVIEGHEAIIERLGPYILDPNITKVAHNAQFERVAFSAALGYAPRHYLAAADWEDTMVMAAEAGYPQKLEDLAVALGGEQKDSAGTRLINTFSKPSKNGRVYGSDQPEKWADYLAYCAQDVETLISVHQNLPKLSEQERQIWITDQTINDRGMKADLASARLAVEQDEQYRQQASQQLQELLGINNAGSVQQVKAGLAELGLDLPDLRADRIKQALTRDDLTGDQRQALELRADLALVASKKYLAVLDSTNQDGRLRGSFRFFGAHTGRWSGRGVQLQNLPRAQVSRPLAHIADLHLGHQVGPRVLKALVRAMFVGPFVVSDYSAIEARVLAWVAGEKWALDAFEGGRDIYVETAERMGGMTRQQGKVAVLALGYQGGVNSLWHMGAQGDDATLDKIKVRWRQANKNIVRLWSKLEEAFSDGGKAGRLRVRVVGADRHLILPSGRAIVYRNVRWETWRFKDEETGATVRKQGWRFDGRYGRADTYGGRLTENAVQAISRDLLANALVTLEGMGLPVVGHVHDEVIVDSDEEYLEQVNLALCAAPDWAEGLPLNAEGFTCARYQKG